MAEISFGIESFYFFFLIKKSNKKNQSAAADKMKLVRTFEYSPAMVRLTS